LLTTVLAPIDRDQIRSPHDIASYLELKIGHECQEQFCATCLNTRNRVQKTHVVYQGNVNSAIIRPGESFREPIRLNSTAVIFSHVHPSGEVTPSPVDVLITRELVAAGQLLDIPVLDHLIIGQGKWISMRERNLGFDKS
jgi:DNA repair protein RadC